MCLAFFDDPILVAILFPLEESVLDLDVDLLLGERLRQEAADV